MPHEGSKPCAVIRAIFFDVGETLVDETRQWALWADWLQVPRPRFFAAFRAVIERGDHHRRVFEEVAPGVDINAAATLREAAGQGYRIERRDFYPDALPCLRALKAEGYLVGIAGNQPEGAEAALKACDLGVDFIASSAGWGIAKPDPRFFEKIIELTGLAPRQTAYVGDRLDNDILPAREAGLLTVFLERGPWGRAHARLPECSRADARIMGLAELPAVLRPG